MIKHCNVKNAQFGMQTILKQTTLKCYENDELEADTSYMCDSVHKMQLK